MDDICGGIFNHAQGRACKHEGQDRGDEAMCDLHFQFLEKLENAEYANSQYYCPREGIYRVISFISPYGVEIIGINKL
jgi:hypothetical protein